MPSSRLQARRTIVGKLWFLACWADCFKLKGSVKTSSPVLVGIVWFLNCRTDKLKPKHTEHHNILRFVRPVVTGFQNYVSCMYYQWSIRRYRIENINGSGFSMLNKQRERFSNITTNNKCNGNNIWKMFMLLVFKYSSLMYSLTVPLSFNRDFYFSPTKSKGAPQLCLIPAQNVCL